MMRYFFHIRSVRGTILDEEGDELADAGQARLNAVQAVRELVAGQIRIGQTIPDNSMEVHDEAGSLVCTVSFHGFLVDQLET